MEGYPMTVPLTQNIGTSKVVIDLSDLEEPGGFDSRDDALPSAHIGRRFGVGVECRLVVARFIG
jgi:hypothetical protein